MQVFGEHRTALMLIALDRVAYVEKGSGNIL